jgi:hypothetical protein
MHQFAAIALVVSSLLSAAAVAFFRWSMPTAKWLLLCALAVAILGVLAVGLAGSQGGLTVWIFLFACGACGCNANAARNLVRRPPRWVHRFVIYAGYGATFAGMGAVGLWLRSKAITGTMFAVVLIGAYIVGSICIFVAKTLTVRLAAKTMPEYHASLAAGQGGYW